MLLSLILKDHVNLKTEAIRILYSLHTNRFKIQKSLEDQVILELVDSKKAYREFQDLSVVIRIFGESSEKWYFNHNGEQFKTFKYMLEEIEKLLLKPKPKVMGELDEESPRSADEKLCMVSQFDSANSIELIKSYFVMKMEHGVDPFYQSMFRHLGMFESLSEVLNEDLNSSRNDLNSDHDVMIERIYFILAYSITQN